MDFNRGDSSDSRAHVLSGEYRATEIQQSPFPATSRYTEVVCCVGPHLGEFTWLNFHGPSSSKFHLCSLHRHGPLVMLADWLLEIASVYRERIKRERQRPKHWAHWRKSKNRNDRVRISQNLGASQGNCARNSQDMRLTSAMAAVKTFMQLISLQ